MSANLDKLWKQYVKTRSPQFRERLLLEYIPLVKYVVDRLPTPLPPCMETEDLVSAGILGLMDAIEGFDPQRGVKFETYAVPRIKGAILDELRSLDWKPRSLRHKVRLLERELGRLEDELGRAATEEEVATRLNMEVQEYRQLLEDIGNDILLSLEEALLERHLLGLATASDGFDGDPINKVEWEEIKKVLVEAIEELPEREKLVVALYYYEELTLKEIGRVLGISESRISQIHGQAILRLRGKIKDVVAA